VKDASRFLLTRRQLLQLAALAGVPFARARGETTEATRRWSLLETARGNGHRLAALPAPLQSSGIDSANIRIDPQRRAQRILGFGGALTESAAYVLDQLPRAKRAQVLRSYFDPAEGIGYTLARTHIGSCDFSRSSWSLDDTAGDLKLRHFSLAPMRKRQLPLIRDAQRLVGADKFKLLASPWSPPAWMKTNSNMNGGGSLLPACRDAWAQHYVRFVKAMHDEERIPVWALTVQNEPDAAQPWESCLYSAWEERDFVAEALGPALRNAGLADVKLFGWDHNRNALEERAFALLRNPSSAQYMSGLAIHWYRSEDFAAAQRTLRSFPNAQILFTEGCVEGGPHRDEWEPAERYARNIIGDLSHGVCGYIDWNIALDTDGGPNHADNYCHAPVLIDIKAGEPHYQPSFYYIAHFSKYVHPGAVRLELHNATEGLQALACVNPDDSIAAIVCNPGEQERAFTLAIADDARACNVPAHAIQTYVVA
jgi:glucosylceramidase